jgi:hypothetical protein
MPTTATAKMKTRKKIRQAITPLETINWKTIEPQINAELKKKGVKSIEMTQWNRFRINDQKTQALLLRCRCGAWQDEINNLIINHGTLTAMRYAVARLREIPEFEYSLMQKQTFQVPGFHCSKCYRKITKELKESKEILPKLHAEWNDMVFMPDAGKLEEAFKKSFGSAYYDFERIHGHKASDLFTGSNATKLETIKKALHLLYLKGLKDGKIESSNQWLDWLIDRVEYRALPLSPRID